MKFPLKLRDRIEETLGGCVVSVLDKGKYVDVTVRLTVKAIERLLESAG